MLVMLGSPAYFASPNCLREVAAALRHKVAYQHCAHPGWGFASPSRPPIDLLMASTVMTS